MYQDKLLRLLHAFVLNPNKEISLFMGVLYLNYGGGFVAGTSDLLWDPTHKKSLGACNANFMAHLIVYWIVMKNKSYELTRLD